MTPAQNRLRRSLRSSIIPVLDTEGNRIGRNVVRLDKDFQPTVITYYEKP